MDSKTDGRGYSSMGFVIASLLVVLYSISSEAILPTCNEETAKTSVKDGRCQPGTYSCRMIEDDTTVCQTCPQDAFSDKWIKVGTKCKNRERCDDPTKNTFYEFRGNVTTDAICRCKPGFYCTEINMCLQNKRCPKGMGVTGKGECIHCGPGTFSNINDRVQACQAAKRCEDFNKCTVGMSTNSSDTICSDYTVLDQSKCPQLGSTPESPPTKPTSTPKNATTTTSIPLVAILTSTFGGVAILVVVVSCVIAYYKKKMCFSSKRNSNGFAEVPNGVQGQSTALGMNVPDATLPPPAKSPEKQRGMIPSSVQINQLSSKLGRHWIALGSMLHCTDADMDNFMSLSSNDIKSAARRMLEWARNKGVTKGFIIKQMEVIDDIPLQEYKDIFKECFPFETAV